MNKQQLKKWGPSLIGLICAILLTGIAVSIYLEIGLGSDTITVFADGLHNVFHVSQGGGSRIYNLIFLIIALIVGRRYIGWTTVVYAFSCGFFIDFFQGILMPLELSSMNFVLRFLSLLVAQCCYGMSFALLIRYQKGMCQVDAVAQAICDKTKASFRIVRTGLDAVLLCLGWLMGGVVGVGSILAMVTTGTFITFFRDGLNKLLGKVESSASKQTN